MRCARELAFFPVAGWPAGETMGREQMLTTGYDAILISAGPDQIKLPLAMLLVFGSAKLLDEVFERLQQPGIVGQIVAGILLGPSVLGWLSPDNFFPALTELGLVFLLFQVGLQVKSSDLMKSWPTATLVAALGVVIPFFAGWALLSAWGEAADRVNFRGSCNGGHRGTSFEFSTSLRAPGNLLAKWRSHGWLRI
jgi:Sodium/hydrogen exchanger family